MSPNSVKNCPVAGPEVPLSFLKNNESGRISRISGKEEVRKYLTDIGFLQGTTIKTVNAVNGNVIVDVKGSKIAIDAKMASKIYVTQ